MEQFKKKPARAFPCKTLDILFNDRFSWEKWTNKSQTTLTPQKPRKRNLSQKYKTESRNKFPIRATEMERNRFQFNQGRMLKENKETRADN